METQVESTQGVVTPRTAEKGAAHQAVVTRDTVTTEVSMVEGKAAGTGGAPVAATMGQAEVGRAVAATAMVGSSAAAMG